MSADAQPVAPAAQVWGWLRFGFRAFAALTAGVMVWGWILLFRVQAVARTTGCDPFFLSLRCVEFDSDRVVWPLFPFDPRGDPAVKGSLADPLRAPTAAEYQAARQLVGSVYDLDAPAVRETVLAWGDGLARIGKFQAALRADRSLPDARAAAAAAATPDEAYLAVAVVLCGTQPNAERDLPRLRALAATAFPAAADRAAALAWAAGHYDRLAAAARSARSDAEVEYRKGDRGDWLRKLDIPVTLPPRTPETLWWLVYRSVGLDAASRRAAADRWPGLFPGTDPDRVRAIAERIERARRAAGERLPPASDALPWVCLVERYHGLDAQGERERVVSLEHFDTNSRRVIGSALLHAAPSDDLFYLLASSDPLHLLPDMGGLRYPVVVVVLLAVYGFWVWLFPVLAEFCLRLGDDPTYRAYRDRRGHGSVQVRLAGYAVVALVGWVVALVYLPDHLVPLAGSAQSKLFASFMAVLLGGTFLGFLTRLAAIVLIRWGADVNRVWYDELLGLTVGLPLLAYLGVDMVGLALIASVELVPMLLQPRPGPVAA